MLYDRWREIARAAGPETALRDWADGRRWTFARMLALSDQSTPPIGEVVFPRGNGPEFIFETLRGWRHGRAVCPLEESDPQPDFQAPPPPGIVHIKRTSATTGAARHIVFTAGQLAADPGNIVQTMGLQPAWPNLGAISLAHSYGFSNLVLPLLLHGVPLWLLRSALPDPLRSALLDGDSFTLAGVPALWRVWNDAGVISPKVRLAISAGAPLPVALEADVFQRAGVKIHNFLGASECGGIAFDRAATPRVDGSMAGTALENVSLSVVDGLLEVRGPAVGAGYWPEARGELAAGVFRSSDLVEIRDGALFILGRAADVIHVAGRKVAPEEIERALMRHPSIRDCVVFDAPRADAENQIVAVAVGSGVRADLMRAWLAEWLPAWQVPRQWRFVDSLAANERGKISRARWRQRFIAGEI